MAGPTVGAVDEPSGHRFQDPGWTIEDLAAHDVLVVCPACGGCARVAATARPEGPVSSWPRRLVCARCGLAEDRPSGAPGWHLRPGRDPFFSAPLWLREPCCGRELWALNGQHLDLLRSHVGARLRQRPPDRGAATSVLERLPAWVTSAKHRTEVLRSIERLYGRLPR